MPAEGKRRMSGHRKNWGEGFAFGLLIGIVAAVSYLAGRPAPARTGGPHLLGTAPARLTGRGSSGGDARLLAESPSPSVH